jgi:hypothetical protein
MFSTARPAHASIADGSGVSPLLRSFTNELDDMTPRFDVWAKDIVVLQSPTEFYDVLKVSNSRRIANNESDQDFERQIASVSISLIYRTV